MVDILAIGAHPDDIEFGIGGILARAHSEGRAIALCDLTLGEKGTNGTPDQRREESLAAADLLDAQRLFLSFRDCEIADTYEGRLELVRVIRHTKPKLILAPMWRGEGEHPDHIATGLLARAACRYARLAKILPDLPIHRPQGILHYPGRACDGCDFLIDISSHLDTWQAMIDCHASQAKTNPYHEWCLRAASRAGMLIGVDYAQGLVKGNPIAIDDPLTIARGTLEL